MGGGQRKEKSEDETWRMEERKRWWDQGARKGRRELEAPRAEAGAGTEGALTLLFTSTMLSGLRAGVLCGLAMAGPGGPRTVPQAARRSAGVQRGQLARAAPPLAVALAPPPHPDLDVKGAATESGTRSPRFLGNGDGDGDVFVCSDIITLPSVSSRSLEEGLGQSEGRVTEVIFIECCLYTISFGLTRLHIL